MATDVGILYRIFVIDEELPGRVGNRVTSQGAAALGRPSVYWPRIDPSITGSRVKNELIHYSQLERPQYEFEITPLIFPTDLLCKHAP